MSYDPEGPGRQDHEPSRTGVEADAGAVPGPEAEAPHLDFAGTTPYEDYV